MITINKLIEMLTIQNQKWKMIDQKLNFFRNHPKFGPRYYL
jgi:hypothetical protein